jgi:hypothetical protein
MKLRRILRGRKLAAVITDQDMGHMKRFSPHKKQKIIGKIMSKKPVEESSLHGNTSYARALLRLRARGLQLIDVQPQETVFTTVWYRQNRSLLGRMKLEVAAMLVWEFGGHEGDSTTMRIWHI